MTYMDLCIHMDGKIDLYLRVPTYWNADTNKWLGMMKTPISLNLITGNGDNSESLQQSFLTNMKTMMSKCDDLADEIISMFRAKEYWEK